MLPYFRMQYSSATNYISGTNMEKKEAGGGGGGGGGGVSNILKLIFDFASWDRYGTHNVDQTPSANITGMSMTPTCMDIVQLATSTYLPLNMLSLCTFAGYNGTV